MSGPSQLNDLSSQERRELLTKLLERRSASETIYPVSFAQRRFWFLHRLAPDSAAYNIPLAIRIRGRIDLSLLHRSLNEIVRRHEILRTTFAQSAPDAEPEQVVHPAVEIAVPLERLDDESAHTREAAMLRRANEAARRPFDLVRGPLVTAEILRLSEDHHVLILVMHHIIVEPWSVAVLFRELEVLYNAFLRGAPSPLADLPIQFGDFARWQRHELTGERFDRGMEYWQRQLAGDVPALQLPVDLPRPAERSLAGGFRARRFSRELSDAVAAFAQREGATHYAVLLTGFSALLHRYTGAREMLIGAAVAERSLTETEPLIGLFLNTIVMRIDVAGDPTCSELLGRIRGVVIQGLTHQQTPFDTVVERLQPNRDPASTPFFQVLFGADDEPSPKLRLGDEAVGEALPPEHVHNGTSKVDLTVLMRQGADGLTAGAEYSAQLFREDTIDRLLSHFETLLQAMVSAPHTRISELEIIPDAEKRQIKEWTAPHSVYPRHDTVHQLFEAVVRQRPHATALTGRESVTYDELNRRANRLAHRLRRLGVGTEAIVGICLDRSVDMIAALLAVLKAGASYLPLDPNLPRERLEFMLEDAGVAEVLTATTYGALFPRRRRLVCLDTIEDIDEESSMNPSTEVSALNLAYVIYTSGSTGLPKGTRVPHRGIVRLVRNTNFVEIGVDDVFLQLASISFDASTFEIWGPLLNGATLALFPPGTPSLSELGREIQRRGVTVLRLAASLYHQMVDANPDGLRGVRQMVAAGDVLSVPHIRKALEIYHGSRIINGYGPTENTGLTTCCRMDHPSQIAASVPIGRPISNTSVYLLDEHLRRVPIGVPGELYTGGDGVARDYLKRRGLTAERFVPDPFSPEPGARMYRTGDRARYLSDGRIEFLGRTDRQVKVRGFRVELGEVEAGLLSHPSVRQAAVVTHDVTPEYRRLVAYVASRDVVPTAEDLRSHLGQRLPQYMMPSTFVFLDAMPTTPNGKIDRRALPAPEDLRAEADGDDAFAPPADDVERAIGEIWRTVLRVDRVGRHDNFFDLGGHSLLLIQVLTRLERVFSRDVPLMDLFRHPTIAELAPLFAESREERAASSVPVREPFDRVQSELESFFFGDDESLFGCYHPPRSSVLHSSAVVICQPMGHEYISYHRACRDLAQNLAERGFAVLRFDYYGTGDSAGASDEGDVERWVADVGAAVAETRRRSGCDKVSAIGLRLGGSLATLAAGGGGYDRLVLWDPIVRGERLVSELEAGMHRALSRAHVRASPTLLVPRPPEALGFPMPERRWEDLSRVNLLAVAARPARDVLLIDSVNTERDSRLERHLLSLGSSVEVLRFPSADRWTWKEDVNVTEHPQDIIRSLVSWLDQNHP